MGFEDRLRQERLRRHLSQERLAEALNVSPSSILRWERGQAVPHTSVQLQLSRFFGITVEDLFKHPETPKQRSLSILELALGQEHPNVAFPLDGLANLYRDQKKYEQAATFYQRAFAISELHLGPAHPQTGEIQREYQSLLSQRSQASETTLCELQDTNSLL